MTGDWGFQKLICVDCGQRLKWEDNQLSCDCCGTSVPVDRQVPDFLLPETSVETTYQVRPRRVGPHTELRTESLFDTVRQVLHAAQEWWGRYLDVLDVGCGNRLVEEGRHYRMLREVCRSYTGIDPSVHIVEQLKNIDRAYWKLPEPTLIRASGESMPIESESMDVALNLSTLDHCIDPRRVLDETHRILRPAGTSIIILGNWQSWQFKLLARLAPGYMRRWRARDHHQTHYLPHELEKLLMAHDFSPTERFEYGYTSLPGRFAPLERLYWPGRRLGISVNRFLESRWPERGSTYLIVARRD